jgi:hypothetical protein
VDSFFQDVHGNGAAAQDFIVERANVEFIAQLILGLLAKLQNCELADFVA